MCLLAVLSRVHPDAPLIVAANRDEWLERPAVAMTTLRASAPRILGGRDELAGGTWLAVADTGVVAGLTNKPTGGRDAARRSRGELPLLLAREPSAAAAAELMAASIRPVDYNPCWILVGDRDRLFYVDLTDGETATALELPPGLHVLENRPLDAPSPKAAWVRAALAEATRWHGDELHQRLAAMLASHELPDGATDTPADGMTRPAATEAACVHAGPYGTRSSTIVSLPEDGAAPRIRYTDGPPCTAEWRDTKSSLAG